MWPFMVASCVGGCCLIFSDVTGGKVAKNPASMDLHRVSNVGEKSDL